MCDIIANSICYALLQDGNQVKEPYAERYVGIGEEHEPEDGRHDTKVQRRKSLSQSEGIALPNGEIRKSGLEKADHTEEDHA